MTTTPFPEEAPMNLEELIIAYEQSRLTDRRRAASLCRRIEYMLSKRSATGPCQAIHGGFIYTLDGFGDLVRVKAATGPSSLRYDIFAAGPGSIVPASRRKRAS
jgi:hypothetical protein